jgi:hypothetical protein
VRVRPGGRRHSSRSLRRTSCPAGFRVSSPSGRREPARGVAGWPLMGTGRVSWRRRPVVPAGGSACSAALPEMVRLPPAARVISTRRARALGEAGMVTCRTVGVAGGGQVSLDVVSCRPRRGRRPWACRAGRASRSRPWR